MSDNGERTARTGLTRRFGITRWGRAAHEYGVTPAPETLGPARQNASGTLRLGVIGCGGMGRGDMGGLMNHPNVAITAVCDPDAGHSAQAAKMVEDRFGKRPIEEKDFRKV